MRFASPTIPILIALWAAPTAGLDTVYVVRHLQKVAEPAWDAHGRLRPLSVKGAQCTIRLADHLAEAGIAAVYASETTRTLTTGAAVSGAQAATLTGDDATVRDTDAFAGRAREAHAEHAAILVVGHSNTVGALVTAFRPDAAACLDRLGLRDDATVDERRYGDLWRVDLASPACSGGVERTELGSDDGVDCMTP